MVRACSINQLRRGAILLAVALAPLACGPASPQSRPAAEQSAPAVRSAPQKTLVMAIRAELPSVAARPLLPFSQALYPPLYLFNAALNYRDELEVPRPYLAELPQLN